MTTPDSKYKHKPSEKHTLEEVLKSLQDLIRNDLLDKDQSAASAETPNAASTLPKAKPGYGGMDLTPEDFAPTSPAAGPVNLEAVMRSLKNLIGNELNVGDELVPKDMAPATSASEQQDAIERPSEEFLSLDEELKPQKPEDVTIGTEASYAEASIAPPLDQPVTRETAPEEFILLDEELSLGESTEIAPFPPAVSAIPDVPGEISPELLSKPELAAPPETSQPEPENKIVPGTQQELPLDRPPLSASEDKPATLNIAPQTELGPVSAAASTDMAPQIVSAPSAENTNKSAEERLPTIEVEETFDAGAYFETETRQAEPPPSDAQEIQEIIATVLDTRLALEKLLPAPMSSTDGTQSINRAPVPESDKTPPDKATKLEILEEPATETQQHTSSVDFDTIDVELPYRVQDPSSLTSEPSALADKAPPPAVEPPAAPEATPDKATKLEILEEPATETQQHTSSVDFDTIDVELPYRVQDPSSLTSEPSALADKAPPPAVEPPAAPEATPEFDTQSVAPTSPEITAQRKPESAAGVVPDSIAIPPPPGETHKFAGETVSTESKPVFNLDDIPVLNEVVAPPAGSTLMAEPASPAARLPLSAPERARDIVVRAVAKLNVEMRKTGGTGLDTKTILRLQQLIRQELEKESNKSQK